MKDNKIKNTPSIDEAGAIAVGLSEHLNTQEQAFFIAGFQECVKYLSSPQKECSLPSDEEIEQAQKEYTKWMDEPYKELSDFGAGAKWVRDKFQSQKDLVEENEKLKEEIKASRIRMAEDCGDRLKQQAKDFDVICSGHEAKIKSLKRDNKLMEKELVMYRNANRKCK